MTKSNNSVISEKLCNMLIVRDIRYCGLQENFPMTLCLNYLREKTNKSVHLFRWQLGGFRPLTLYKTEGIYGSTVFAENRILQEGGKTIEALFWPIL